MVQWPLSDTFHYVFIINVLTLDRCPEPCYFIENSSLLILHFIPSLIVNDLKHLLLECEPKLFALESEHLGKYRVPTVEHSNLALVLLPELQEHLVPVGSPRIGPGLEAGDEVAVLLLVHEVECQLQTHCLHVCALESRCDVPRL